MTSYLDYAAAELGSDGQWRVRCRAFRSTVYCARNEDDAKELANAFKRAKYSGIKETQAAMREALGIND